MMEITSRRTWFICIIILMSLGISLACVGSGVKPDDPRLQPPLSTMGLTFEDFLKQLKAVPRSGIMSPWITVPGDTTFSAPLIIEVSGWAQFIDDAELVIYEVESDPTLERVVATNRPLGHTTVDETAKSWQMQVTLPERRQYLAARLERPNGRHSPFSNIIYVSRGEPEALLITSPQPEAVITTTLTLLGTGEPKVGLVVVVNDETTPLTTVVADDGAWVISDIPLVVAGFDVSAPVADRNRNRVSVIAEATGQTATIAVRRIEPIRLVWPYRKVEGETTVPDFDIATLTAFYYNDWHWYTTEYDGKPLKPGPHYALDLSSGKATPLYAVADGTVVGVGSSSSGNYLTVDAGGWGFMYLHIVENAAQLKGKGIEPGVVISAGQHIATEGGSGGFPVHLHIEARVWEPDVDRSSFSAFFKQTPINLNPSSSYWTYFQTKRINLYDWWGRDDYCQLDGCWKDADWEEVKLDSSPTELYEQGCWNDKGQWTGGTIFNARTTRARYCQDNPAQCPCRK